MAEPNNLGPVLFHSICNADFTKAGCIHCKNRPKIVGYDRNGICSSLSNNSFQSSIVHPWWSSRKEIRMFDFITL